MLTVLSPAKTLDFESPSPSKRHTQPAMLDASELLIDVLSTKSPDDLQQLMGISPQLAELNVERIHKWERPFTAKNAKAALFAFKGDVYVGLDAPSLAESDLAFAQDHLRILSGLYGVLRPLDLMQAYRLEMGTALQHPGGDNLYQFWGTQITDNINSAVAKSGSAILLNLASNEYFKAVKKKDLAAELVTPAFRDWKNGQYKMISFFAKKARGLMAAWVIKERINDAAGLTEFALDGYRFNPELSQPQEPVFTRKAV